MQIDGWQSVFLAGCFGGFLVEVLRWYGLRESPRLPRYTKSYRYWLITAVMILCGGVLATLYGIASMSAILAVNIGASAPLIISSLARANAPPKKERGAGRTDNVPEASVIGFLAGR